MKPSTPRIAEWIGKQQNLEQTGYVFSMRGEPLYFFHDLDEYRQFIRHTLPDLDPEYVDGKVICNVTWTYKEVK